MKKIIIFVLSFIFFFVCLEDCCRACSKSSVEIAFTGDILMHLAVKACAKEHNILNGGVSCNHGGFDFLFSSIKDELNSVDLLSGNMEFPICPPFIQNEFIFNCPPEIVGSLKANGFDVLNLANNHIYDQKVKGIHYTLNLLKKEKVKILGVNFTKDLTRKGILFEKNGIKVVLLAYTDFTNYGFRKKQFGYYLNNFNNEKQLAEDIVYAKSIADYVIVQIHAGTEYVLQPTNRDIQRYHHVLNLGADMIIGHHPHLLQYVEKYETRDQRNCLIFYSLGNFISDQKKSVKLGNDLIDIRNSIIVKLKLSKKKKKIETEVTVIPVYTENYRFYQNKKIQHDIRVVSLKKELKKIEKNSDDKSRKKRILYQQKLLEIENVLFQKGQPAIVKF